VQLNRRHGAADDGTMNAANEHVFSHGVRDTRDTFEAWNGHPWTVLRSWLALSLAIALTLLRG
jgi:hypothetical protein